MKMRFKFNGNFIEKIENFQKQFYRDLALMMIRRSMKNRKPNQKTSRFPGFLKSCFKLSVFVIIPSYMINKRYKYYLENDPQFLRE